MVKMRIIRPSVLDLKVVYNLFVNRQGITIGGLADNLKVNYKNTHNAVNELFDLGIIKKEKMGNYNVCKLNYSNEEIVGYLKEYNHYFRINGFRKKHPDEYSIITETIKRIIHSGFTGGILRDDKIEDLHICLLFGSYSKDEMKSDSDVDVLFISTHGSIGYKKVLEKVNLPYQKKFHVVEQKLRDFIPDAQNKNEVSVATELGKYPPIIFYGDDAYFRIMIEASKSW